MGGIIRNNPVSHTKFVQVALTKIVLLKDVSDPLQFNTDRNFCQLQMVGEIRNKLVSYTKFVVESLSLSFI